MSSHDKHALLARLRNYGDGLTDTLARMDALEAANRISAPSTERAQDEYCWLVERGQAEGQTPTLWLVGPEYKSGEQYNGIWTEDATKARKFKSGADAGRYARGAGIFNNFRCTEHAFLDNPALSSARKPTSLTGDNGEISPAGDGESPTMSQFASKADYEAATAKQLIQDLMEKVNVYYMATNAEYFGGPRYDDLYKRVKEFVARADGGSAK